MRRALGFLLAAAALASPAPTAAEPAWLQPLTLSPLSFTVGLQGDVAIDGAGNVFAAWVWVDDKGDDSAANDVQVAQFAHRPPGGAFGPAINLSALGRKGADPAIAYDSAGNALIVWAEDLGSSEWQVRMVRRAADGTLGPIEELSGVGAQYPQVAVAGDGTATFVWAKAVSGGTHIESRTRAPDGALGQVKTVKSIASDLVKDVELAVNEAGVAAATWLVYANGGGFPQAAYRPAGGNWDGNDPSLAESHFDPSTSIVVDPQGTAIVAFTGTQAGVSAAARLPAGTAFTPASGQGIDGGAEGYGVELGVDAQGYVTAVWRSDSFATKTSVRPPGGSFGTSQVLSGIGAWTESQRLAVAPSGAAIVSWLRKDGQIYRPEAVVRPAGGVFGPVRALPLIADATSAFMGRLAVDSAANGVWLAEARTPEANSLTRYRWQAAFHDATPPELRTVTVPSSAVTGEAAAMSADVFDKWSPVTISWDFGDGSTAAGAAVSHAYAAAGSYTVRATATDAVGNEATAERAITVAVPAPPATPPASQLPLPRLTATLQRKQLAGKRFTTFTRLRLVRVPKGASVQARCIGRGCPLKRRAIRVDARGTADVLEALKRKRLRLRAGSTFELRVTAAGAVGDVHRLRVRAKRKPSLTRLCLAPGATRPAAC